MSKLEVITKLNSAEDVSAAYEEHGVNKNRRDSLNDNYSQLPPKFKIYGLVFVTLNINGQKLENIPAFAISEDGRQTVLVGTFKQTYTDKSEATQITKETANKGKWLVVNNCKVHPFAINKSEADLVVDAIGKTFTSKPSENFKVFVPQYIKRKPQYAETAEEAMEMVTNTSYSVIELLG